VRCVRIRGHDDVFADCMTVCCIAMVMQQLSQHVVGIIQDLVNHFVHYSFYQR